MREYDKNKRRKTYIKTGMVAGFLILALLLAGIQMLSIIFWFKLLLSLAVAGIGIGIYALYMEHQKGR